MPKVKAFIDEVTDGRLPITGDYAADLAAAVEHEHPCTDDNACDIAAALEQGFIEVAAGHLIGATEAPLTERVLAFYGKLRKHLPYDSEEWDSWYGWFKENAVPCGGYINDQPAGCGAFIFDYDPRFDTGYWCHNCGAYTETTDNEEGDD